MAKLTMTTNTVKKKVFAKMVIWKRRGSFSPFFRNKKMQNCNCKKKTYHRKKLTQSVQHPFVLKFGLQIGSDVQVEIVLANDINFRNVIIQINDLRLKQERRCANDFASKMIFFVKIRIIKNLRQLVLKLLLPFRIQQVLIECH